MAAGRARDVQLHRQPGQQQGHEPRPGDSGSAAPRGRQPEHLHTHQRQGHPSDKSRGVSQESALLHRDPGSLSLTSVCDELLVFFP